ncbi:hypothetical protein PIROE2DRAFT_16914 [Piromyces sp. E2]|nr:hypothetical protein PIROE2DRAFT_16914 [Piromyces sp. E2]|eukprot:OUM57944.1 hypothetical protein PIROE2DRAFT_16914 [Piromyces sp. E2]
MIFGQLTSESVITLNYLQCNGTIAQDIINIITFEIELMFSKSYNKDATMEEYNTNIQLYKNIGTVNY